MAKATPPIQQVQQSPDGTWQVAVTWRDGRKERHGSFQSELEAKEWALNQLRAWEEGNAQSGKT